MDSYDLDGNRCFVIERILGCQKIAGEIYYAIKWEGSDEVSLEPEEKLNPELVSEYRASGLLNILNKNNLNNTKGRISMKDEIKINQETEIMADRKSNSILKVSKDLQYGTESILGESSGESLGEESHLSKSSMHLATHVRYYTDSEISAEGSPAYYDILNKYMTNLLQIPHEWTGRTFYIYGPKLHPEVKTLRRYLASQMVEDITCRSSKLLIVLVHRSVTNQIFFIPNLNQLKRRSNLKFHLFGYTFTIRSGIPSVIPMYQPGGFLTVSLEALLEKPAVIDRIVHFTELRINWELLVDSQVLASLATISTLGSTTPENKNIALRCYKSLKDLELAKRVKMVNSEREGLIKIMTTYHVRYFRSHRYFIVIERSGSNECYFGVDILDIDALSTLLL